MSLQVLQFATSNRNHNLNLEELYRRYAAYSGVQTFHFDDRISSFDGWPVTAVPVNTGIVTFDLSTDKKSIVRTTATTPNTTTSDAWTYVSSEEMKHSYSFEFTPYTSNFMVTLNCNNTPNSMGYKMWFNVGYVNVERRYDSNSAHWKQVFNQSFLSRLLNPNLYGRRIKVSVRDTPASYNTTRRILYVNVWVDDALLFTFSDNTGVVSGNKIAFTVFNNDTNPVVQIPPNTVVLSNFRLSNLNEVIEWSSLDPGEPPMTAIQRAVEDRYIKAYARWDNTLRAWRPNATSNEFIPIAQDQYRYFHPSIDERQIITDLRLRGPFHWVRVTDDELLDTFGHRFHQIDNTSLWSAEDCYNEALQIFIRIKEQIYRTEIEIFGGFYIEPESYLEIVDPFGDTIHCIVDTINMSRNQDTVVTSLSLRKYSYA